MTTRFVHVVRCADPNNSMNYVDVQITDKISVQGANGQDFKIDVTAANAVPGVTRQSHFIQVTSDSDSTQMLNVEVLDKFCVTGTNGQQWVGNFSSVNAKVYFLAVNGPDLGTLTSPEETIVGDIGSASRLANVNEVSNPNNSSQFMAIESFQEISFTGVNGQQWKYDLRDQNRSIVDTTQYNMDGSPPANTDPNPYITFPSSTGGPWTGNSLVSQGPLWQVVNASGGAQNFLWMTLLTWYDAISSPTPPLDGSPWDEWYLYNWNPSTSPGLILGYCNTQNEPISLQVPHGADFDQFNQILASTQGFPPGSTWFEGVPGHAQGWIQATSFNLSNLVGYDKSSGLMGADFEMDFILGQNAPVPACPDSFYSVCGMQWTIGYSSGPTLPAGPPILFGDWGQRFGFCNPLNFPFYVQTIVSQDLSNVSVVAQVTPF